MQHDLVGVNLTDLSDKQPDSELSYQIKFGQLCLTANLINHGKFVYVLFVERDIIGIEN